VKTPKNITILGPNKTDYMNCYTDFEAAVASAIQIPHVLDFGAPGAHPIFAVDSTHPSFRTTTDNPRENHLSEISKAICSGRILFSADQRDHLAHTYGSAPSECPG